MVVAVGSVAAMILSGGAAAPVVATVMAESTAIVGAGTGAIVGAAATTTGVTAIGAGMAAGTAIATSTGTIVAASATAATTAALTGGTTAVVLTTAAVEAGGAALLAGVPAATVAVTSGTAVATGAPVAAAIITGPVGWAVLGTTTGEASYIWDCWKPVLHESDPTPSAGMLMRDIVADPRLKDVAVISVDEGGSTRRIAFMLTNVWEEKFLLEEVLLSDGSLAFHAVPWHTAHDV